jgi:hypothetical protein
MKNPAKLKERKRLDELGFVRDGRVWGAPECDVVFVDDTGEGGGDWALQITLPNGNRLSCRATWLVPEDMPPQESEEPGEEAESEPST